MNTPELPVDSPFASITYTHARAVNLLCVYAHRIDGVIIYIGYCKLTEVFECPDARANGEWRKVAPAHVRIELIIMEIHENRRSMFLAHSRAVKLHRPHCNIYGYADNRSVRIRNTVDGAIFESASQAAKFYSVSPGAMSNHLARRKGYNTLRGMVFEKVLNDDEL